MSVDLVLKSTGIRKQEELLIFKYTVYKVTQPNQNLFEERWVKDYAFLTYNWYSQNRFE